MATSFQKTYAIVLKFSYEDARAIVDSDLHCAELRTQIKEWITGKVGHVSKGDLSVHIVGTITES